MGSIREGDALAWKNDNFERSVANEHSMLERI